MAKKTTISNNAAKAACDGVVDLLDAGAGAGKLRVYDGTQPANPDVAITTQTLLVEFTLSDPAFGDAADADPGAIATANAIANTTALANGTPSWCRGLDSDDNAITDGSAGTADADLILDAPSVVAGQTVAADSWTATMPES